MALPGHRRTSSHKRRRASHFALKKMVFADCPKCKKQVLPHVACQFCGSYAGRQVLPIKVVTADAGRKPVAAPKQVKETKPKKK